MPGHAGPGPANDTPAFAIVVDLLEDEADVAASEGRVHVLNDSKVLVCAHGRSPVYAGENARRRDRMTARVGANIGKIAYPSSRSFSTRKSAAAARVDTPILS